MVTDWVAERGAREGRGFAGSTKNLCLWTAAVRSMDVSSESHSGAPERGAGLGSGVEGVAEGAHGRIIPS